MSVLESLDRRAFLRGLMVSSAGLLVPKPVMVVVPGTPWRQEWPTFSAAEQGAEFRWGLAYWRDCGVPDDVAMRLLGAKG